MDTDTFEGAACPNADLTARLLAELTRARRELASAEAQAVAALALGHRVPADAQAARIAGRQQLATIRHLLAGMPTIPGVRHVACA